MIFGAVGFRRRSPWGRGAMGGRRSLPRRIAKNTPPASLGSPNSSIAPPLSTRACRSPLLGSCSSRRFSGRARAVPRVGRALVIVRGRAFASSRCSSTPGPNVSHISRETPRCLPRVVDFLGVVVSRYSPACICPSSFSRSDRLRDTDNSRSPPASSRSSSCPRSGPDCTARSAGSVRSGTHRLCP